VHPSDGASVGTVEGLGVDEANPAGVAVDVDFLSMHQPSDTRPAVIHLARYS
jgi:hypothetical protein